MAEFHSVLQTELTASIGRHLDHVSREVNTFHRHAALYRHKECRAADAATRVQHVLSGSQLELGDELTRRVLAARADEVPTVNPLVLSDAFCGILTAIEELRAGFSHSNLLSDSDHGIIWRRPEDRGSAC